MGRAHGPPRPARAVEDLSAKLKPYEKKDWRQAPRFLTPLKPHTVLRGQDCTMTCAFLGNPRPTVTLYKGDVNITANSKFWYNSTSGVCTLVIPTCTLKDSGDYSVLVENELGKDCSSCMLTVYGEGATGSGLGEGERRKRLVLWAIGQLFFWLAPFFDLTTNKWCKHS